MVDPNSVNLCPRPFFNSKLFPDSKGFINGRLCQTIAPDFQCCLPCPLTDWVYPESFQTVGTVANWVATISALCCLYLFLSWALLPVDKTNRHYLSICLTVGVFLMNLGFVVPLAAQPQQCYDQITPHSMHSSKICGASGSLLILGGWSAVMWAFLRSLSLHLQICWQVTVGRTFMLFAQAAGWGVPIVGIILALVFSGVSFRFGNICHINHDNSLADLWIPLLIFAAITVITTFATFGYCVKVYLASLNDGSASNEPLSTLPSYTNSLPTNTMTPGKAYRRVRRVIALQWRGIAIVLIIVIDVIFFSVVFVFQDNVVQSASNNPKLARSWINCLLASGGDKEKCLGEAGKLVINQATVTAVLLLLGLNGIWLIFLLGRRSMITGWIDMFRNLVSKANGSMKKDFVSVNTQIDSKSDTRSCATLSQQDSTAVSSLAAAVKDQTPISIECSNIPLSDQHEHQSAAPYRVPSPSFSAPRSPAQRTGGWEAQNKLSNYQLRSSSPQSPPRSFSRSSRHGAHQEG